MNATDYGVRVEISSGLMVEIRLAEMHGLLAWREKARKAEDWMLSDILRDMLLVNGVKVVDTVRGQMCRKANVRLVADEP